MRRLLIFCIGFGLYHLCNCPIAHSQGYPGRFTDYAETANGLNMEMIAVRSGTFMMGCTMEQMGDCFADEKPVHRVTVSDFYIGKYEVTQAQWEAVMDNNPSFFKGGSLPVEMVSWKDVQLFIAKLNQITGKQYRLPTEAEWEFAARGGDRCRECKYSGSNDIDSVAWQDVTTHPVGTKQPNELGIYDMSGNVSEWCDDTLIEYGRNYQVNPHEPPTANSRYIVFRGGSYSSYDRNSRVSVRLGTDAYAVFSFIGFRLACTSQSPLIINHYL